MKIEKQNFKTQQFIIREEQNDNNSAKIDGNTSKYQNHKHWWTVTHLPIYLRASSVQQVSWQDVRLL